MAYEWEEVVERMNKTLGLPESIKAWGSYTLLMRYGFTPPGLAQEKPTDTIKFEVEDYGKGYAYAAKHEDNDGGWPVKNIHNRYTFPSYTDTEDVISCIHDLAYGDDEPVNFISIVPYRGKSWDFSDTLTDINTPQIRQALESEMKRTGHASLYDFCMDDRVCEDETDTPVEGRWDPGVIEIEWANGTKLEMSVKNSTPVLTNLPPELQEPEQPKTVAEQIASIRSKLDRISKDEQ